MYISLKTPRCILLPLDEKYLESVHAYAADPENTRFIQHLPNKTKAETLAFLNMVSNEWKKEKPEYYEFAILLDNKQIGAVSIYPDHDNISGEMGWILNKHYWKQGFMSEAAEAVKQFAIHTLKLTRLYACCDIRNLPSARVMKKLGMTRIAVNTRNYGDERGEAKEYRYQLDILKEKHYEK